MSQISWNYTNKNKWDIYCTTLKLLLNSVIRFADVAELLLSNTSFTMLATKIQFYYFERSESDLLYSAYLNLCFELLVLFL